MSENLVLDNTVLSHFARANELETLELLCAPYRVLVPVEVHAELLAGVQEYPSLASAITLPWTTAVTLIETAEVVAFAKYHGALGATSTRHRGEAAVLAFVKVNGGVALVDDAAGRGEGARDGVEVRGTLWLLSRG